MSANVTSANGTNSSTTLAAGVNKNNDATKVGIGVGIGVGVPLLAALGAVLFLLSKERRANRELKQITGQGGLLGEKTDGNGYGYGYAGNGRGQSHWHEMPDETAARELPGSATAGREELFGEGIAR